MLGNIDYVIILRVSGKPKLIVISLSALIVAYGVVGVMMEKVSARDDVYKDLSIFTEVIHKVKEDYVEDPSMEKAVKGALHGLMEALDSYSSFVDAGTYQKVQEFTERYTASPGLMLSRRYGYAHVVSVVPGSPAAREGLRSGDFVESIDGKLTTQMSLLEAQSLLLGPSGSGVALHVIRGRRSAPSEVRLTREELALPGMEAKIRDEGIGLLRITHFEKGAAEEVRSKLKMLQSSGIRGLLIDCRGVAQGILEEAVAVADLFLPPGKKILAVRDRRGKEIVYWAATEPMVVGIPMVVLIDGGTSGAAEVFVAALRDHEAAETLGDRSNGQGGTREYFHLGDGSVLYISTQMHYRPNGKPLQDQSLRNSGIRPDVRSPGEDFVTNFYFDNASDDGEKNLSEDFYQKLNEAIEAEQLKAAMERIRSQVLPRAA